MRIAKFDTTIAGTSKCHANSAEQHDQLSGPQHRPATAYEVAGESPAGEVAEIRRQKRHPETDQRVFQFEALGDEVDGKPVGDKEPDRIGERLAKHDAPCLLTPQQGTPRFWSARCNFGSSGFGRLHGINPPPHKQPYHPEQASKDERRPPTAERIVEPHHHHRCDSPADRGAAIEDCDRHAALGFREPFGNSLRRAGPIGRFAGAQHKSEYRKALESGGHGSRHRDHRIPQHCQR